MSLLLNIAVDGIAYGMILFMISVGLSVTMGLMRVINLAHGAFALVGGALAHTITLRWGIGYYVAVPLAIAGTIALALLSERVLFRRIYRLGELQQVLATIGITFMVIAVVNRLLGSSLLSIPLPASLQHSLDLSGFSPPTVWSSSWRASRSSLGWFSRWTGAASAPGFARRSITATLQARSASTPTGSMRPRSVLARAWLPWEEYSAPNSCPSMPTTRSVTWCCS